MRIICPIFRISFGDVGIVANELQGPCVMKFSYVRLSIKYFMLFLTNFDPLPLSHFVTHRRPPIKYVTSWNTPTKDNSASICASKLCKEHSYKYRITAVLHCIVL